MKDDKWVRAELSKILTPKQIEALEALARKQSKPGRPVSLREAFNDAVRRGLTVMREMRKEVPPEVMRRYIERSADGLEEPEEPKLH